MFPSFYKTAYSQRQKKRDFGVEGVLFTILTRDFGVEGVLFTILTRMVSTSKQQG